MADCFPVLRSDRIHKPPVQISFAGDIWKKGEDKGTYAEVLKKPMEEGGRWVW